MKVLIIEDEIAASENLAYLLKNLDPAIVVAGVLETVKTAVDYFREPQELDLVFLDIHLADGLSFEIFDQVEIDTPIIFTTAYDQYALKAFKVNSIDYLLKPIDKEELAISLKQFKKQRQAQGKGLVNDQVLGLLNLIKGRGTSYKSSFLVNHRDGLIPLRTDQLAYFYMDTGVIKVKTVDGTVYMIDKKLEDLETDLDPALYYRANRQFIVSRNAISDIKYYFGGKLMVNVKPPYKERLIISKAKAPDFKKWLDS